MLPVWMSVLAMAGIVFVMFVAFFSIASWGRPPVWEQAGTIVTTILYGIVLTIAAAFSNYDMVARVVYVVSFMAAYYLGKLGAHYVLKWRHSRLVRKYRLKYSCPGCESQVKDTTAKPSWWIQPPPENGGGQPIEADPPKDLR